MMVSRDIIKTKDRKFTQVQIATLLGANQTAVSLKFNEFKKAKTLTNA